MAFLDLVPNWGTPVIETLAFNTEIIESANGREQRIAHRRKPRIELQFSATLPTDQPRKYLHILGSTFGQQTTVVDPSKPAASFVVGSAQGATSVRLSHPAAAGTYALTVGDRAYPVEVASFASGVATLASGKPLPVAVPAGTTLYRTRSGFLGQSNSVNQITDNAMVHPLRLLVAPETVAEPSAYTDPVYETYPRLDQQPNWQRGISLNFNTPYDEVDYTNGVIHAFKKVMSGNFVQGLNYTLDDKGDMEKLRSLFIQSKGQQGQFLAPTFTNDMTLISDVNMSRATITVRFEAEQYFDDLYWITFFKTDGTSFCRRVTQVAASGQNHVLTLNENPSETVRANEVLMLSQTRMCRFASDSLKITYHVADVTSSLHNIKTTMAFDLHVWNDLNIWTDDKIWRDYA